MPHVFGPGLSLETVFDVNLPQIHLNLAFFDNFDDHVLSRAFFPKDKVNSSQNKNVFKNNDDWKVFVMSYQPNGFMLSTRVKVTWRTLSGCMCYI